MVLNQSFLVVGGRRIATELEALGLKAIYVSATDFCGRSVKNFDQFNIMILAHSQVLSSLRNSEMNDELDVGYLLKKFTETPAHKKYFLSSAAVYGPRFSSKSIKENSKLNGVGLYAEEKIYFEKILKKERGLLNKTTILRMPAIIYTNKIFEVGNLMHSIQKIHDTDVGELTIEENGEQIRDFCTSECLARLLQTISSLQTPNVINVADVESINLRALVEGILPKEKMIKIKFLKRTKGKIHCSLNTENLENLITSSKQNIFDVYKKIRK